MNIPSVKLREILFLCLFAKDFTSIDNSYAFLEMIMDELQVARSAVKRIFADSEVIWNCRESLDSFICEVLTEYKIERLQTVERTILRLATYELLFKGYNIETLLPPKIVIAEAKRLTKKFSTPQAVTFIHAVITALAKKHGLGLDQEEHQKIEDVCSAVESIEERALQEDTAVKQLCSAKELQVQRLGDIMKDIEENDEVV